MPYDPSAVNFDFSPDQRSLKEQARKFLSEHASSARVRRILESVRADRRAWCRSISASRPAVSSSSVIDANCRVSRIASAARSTSPV